MITVVGAVGLTILIPRPAAGTENEWEQWSTLTFKHQFTPEIGASLGLRMRFDDDVSRAKDLTIRPAIVVKGAGGMNLGVGYDHIEGLPGGAINEDRAWQSIDYEFQMIGIPLGHRFRVEERFIEDVSGLVVRARYRLRLKHELTDSPWYFEGSDEVFVNLNSQGEGPDAGFDQNRVFLGLGRDLTPRHGLKFGYQFAYQEKRGEDKIGHALIFNFTFQTTVSK
jgi:hypothetical protein